MNRNQNRRKLRNLIVNKKQLMIVIIGSVYLFLSIVLIFMVTVSPVYRDIFQSNEISDQRDSAKVFIVLSEKLVIALFATFILTFIPLIWTTHRIFGPLVNFSNVFKKISGGDLTPRIYLRRGDLLKSEANLANEMIESISKTIDGIKKQNDLLVMALTDMANGDQNKANLNNDELIEIRNHAHVCQKLLSNVKTADPSN